MWLTSSSVGRKFIMALTGACLVLFVTFHCAMNAIAICWPAAYNVICEFLGANWYALIASAGLAVLFILHIIYALWLTLQNRKARGTIRYNVVKPAPGVEWSSKNMLVLGIVVLAFLAVHLIQFWAKMQWVEISGAESAIPPQAGTLFIQEAFSCIWTPIVYIIGFVALWFHMNHGFWSMFQTVGWDNDSWIVRLRKISCWWSTIVVALFIVQAIVFTVKSNEDFYKEDPQLQKQYVSMVATQMGLGYQMENTEYSDFSNVTKQLATLDDAEIQQMQMMGQLPFSPEQVKIMVGFVKYMEGDAVENEINDIRNQREAQMQQMQQMQMQQEVTPETPEATKASESKDSNNQ